MLNPNDGTDKYDPRMMEWGILDIMNHKRRGIEKMKNSKPRNARRSIRLQGYDYSSSGSYFITMNTYQRKRLFGHIHKGVMVLSRYGNIAHQCWLNLAIKKPWIFLDEFIIMPDHMHGIITIKSYRFDKHAHDTTLSTPASKIAGYGQMVPRSISILLRTYKSVVTRWINSQRRTPGERIWQRNYYEHIVRNAEDLNRIRKYIKANPDYWKR